MQTVILFCLANRVLSVCVFHAHPEDRRHSQGKEDSTIHLPSIHIIYALKDAMSRIQKEEEIEQLAGNRDW